jgi:type IV fimbrial biogenesis protein FimT
MKSKIIGFTLIEVLITVTIVSILLAIAVPSYQQLVINNRMTTQANEFLTMLNYTRSEAVKRNTRVTMCKSSDGATCTVTALTSSTASWQSGWIVFVDGSTAGILDGTDTVLKVQGALSGNSTLVGNANVINYVSYTSSGQARLNNGGMQGGTFYLCSPDVTQDGRNIILTQSTSRVRVERDTPPVKCS